MGERPADGVVGTGTFPGMSGAVDTTLTLTALALRTAERILNQEFWVASGRS